MSGVVIIGGGQGGARSAMELRRAGYERSVAILTNEAHVPYERPPLSKEVLVRGTAATASHVVPLAELETRGIALHLDDPVIAIDATGKQVRTRSGKHYGYSHLIVATGATARRVPIPGVGFEGVLTLRDAGDAVHLRGRLADGKRIGIIGGGVLGLEVAAAARSLGLDVVVLEQARNCLERLLPPDAAAPVVALHRAKGVRILCGVRLERICGEGKVSGITLTDGTTLECDLVIMATGSVPNDGLVAAAGGECAGGVLVDDQCRTSLADVFAVGDVALDRNSRLRQESWDNANRQAALVASVIANSEPPIGAPAWFWTDQYDLNLQVVGAPRAGDLLVARPGSRDRQQIQFYLRDGIVSGAVLFDSGRDRRAVAQLIGRRVDTAALADPRAALKQLVSYQ